MQLKKLILDTLKEEVVPAMGCTEPVTVALACAKARELASSYEIKKVEVLVSPNIYKNGLAVGIPHTDEVGLPIAAALGLMCGDSSKGLQVLEAVEKKDVELVKGLVEQRKVLLQIKDTKEKVYVEVRLYTKEENIKVIIEGRHDEFVYLERQGEILLNKDSKIIGKDNKKKLLWQTKIEKIIRGIEEMQADELEFMLQGLEMNEKIALAGLNKETGMGVGKTLYDNIEKGILSDDLMSQAMMLTAAAADARMSGITMPVMSSNGSGNNGLTAVLPIVAYKRKFPTEEEKLAKAVAISHIMNGYIKHYIGRLSALCGCAVSAATGAAMAIAWLMGADYKQMEGVIKNMLANLSGMICDGAKVGCALKLSSSASAAIQSTILAMNHQVVPAGNGIIAETAEDTIDNLRILCEEGMKLTDGVIVDVMKKYTVYTENIDVGA
ncbi:MAG: serine dehydratase subunit alpha family protein [Clostridiaceae bacterium]|nr:serine dehydratase subunit alpha family protein [Clostridiaceae bacterium]